MKVEHEFLLMARHKARQLNSKAKWDRIQSELFRAGFRRGSGLFAAAYLLYLMDKILEGYESRQDI